MSETTNYRSDAMDDAQDTARNFCDKILEMVLDNGHVSDDLMNDYGSGDSYHHESHVDREYRLSEAADVLDQLSDCEETDSGLWEGLAPREAISAQAAYTYGNAVYGRFQKLVEKLNDDDELEELHTAYDNVEDGVEQDLNEHRDLAEEAALDQDVPFIEDEYEPPFDEDEDEDEEVDRRRAALKSKIVARIDHIIDNFN